MNEFLRGKYDVNGSGGKVIPRYLDYPDFTDSFFSTIIREHEGEGVDFWWLDWQQHLTSPIQAVSDRHSGATMYSTMIWQPTALTVAL